MTNTDDTTTKAFHLLLDAHNKVSTCAACYRDQAMYYRNGLLDMFCTMTGQEEAAVVEQIDELMDQS